MLCEATSGYVWASNIYVGQGTQFDPEMQHLEDVTEHIVMSLVKPLLQKGYCITMDNYYTRPNLAKILIAQKTDCNETAHTNRKNMPVQQRKTVLKRGKMKGFRKGNILVLK